MVFFFVSYVENTIVKPGEVIVIANVDRAVVDLYTLTGQLVKTQHIESSNDLVKSTSIPGVYLLQVTTPTEIFTTKIIITE